MAIDAIDLHRWYVTSSDTKEKVRKYEANIDDLIGRTYRTKGYKPSIPIIYRSEYTIEPEVLECLIKNYQESHWNVTHRHIPANPCPRNNMDDYPPHEELTFLYIPPG